MKMWKVYDNNHNDNDDDGQRTNFDKKNLLEPLAQVSKNILPNLCHHQPSHEGFNTLINAFVLKYNHKGKITLGD